MMKDRFFGSIRLAMMGGVVFAGAAAMPLAAQEVTPVDPSQNPAADYVLEGPTVFTAAPGATTVYSGEISGVGPVIVDGGGTVAFSHANNSYTGGTLVSNAVFRLDADGCAGVNAITAAVLTAHVYLNCARIPYSIHFVNGYETGASGSVDSVYPPSGARPLYPLVQSTVITGKVTFGTYTIYQSGNSKNRYSRNNILTFGDDFGVEKSALNFYTYGTIVFMGRYCPVVEDDFTRTVYLGYASSANGVVEFHSSSNFIYRARLYNTDLFLKAPDVFPKSHLYFEYGAKDYCKIDMCGNDQTIRGMSMRVASEHETEDSTGHSFKSTTDRTATLRITGFNKSDWFGEGSLTNRVGFFGNMSLVMDVDPTYTASSFVQVFDLRKNTMTGDLVISNGIFGMVGTVSFQNVPNIYVGTGGAISCATVRANAFIGCTNLVVDGKMAFDDCVTDPFGFKATALTLGDGAELTLPTDYTLTVPSFKIGDTVMPEGTYGDGGTPLGQIKRGTVVVEGFHENVSATWTGGGGSDTSMETAENWSTDTAPNLTDNTLLATFASGGTVATAEGDMRLRGIVLSKSDTGFTIAGEGKTISLDAEGFTFTDTVAADPESPRTYTVEPVLSHFYEAATDFAVPANVTLAFTGGFQQPFGGANSKTGDGTLVFGGNGLMPGGLNVTGGKVEFNGTNDMHGSIISKDADLTIAGDNKVDGQIIVTNATVRLSGKISQEGGPPSNAASTWQWKPDSATMMVDCSMDEYRMPRSRMFFENLDMGKRLGAYGASYNSTGKWFTVTAGSTNIFRAQLILVGSVGYLEFETNSFTRFAGPVSLNGETRMRGSGTVVFSGSTPAIGGGGLCVRDNVKAIFENGGHYLYGGGLEVAGTSHVDFLADNVLTNHFDKRDFLGVGVYLRTQGVLDLHGTKQTVTRLCQSTANLNVVAGDSTATLTGELGSEMRICSGWAVCNVEGGVSITEAATNTTDTTTFTNKAFASCGDIKAESGTMVFAYNASWLNGTNVTVCSDATLKLNASETFGDHAVLHTEGANWHLDLAEGVKQKFAEFLKDGVRQPNGIYGAEGNAAAKYRLANITGAGVIRVGKIGMVVSVR